MTEWNASGYERISSLQEMLAGEALARVELNGSEAVLDVGCGNGKITAEIAKRVPRGSVLGVDPSSDMIAFATQHYATPDRSNLRFTVGDVRSLGLPSEFDLVVSFNALHWVPEQQAALRSLRQALRPGGRALLRFVPEGTRKCLEDVIEDVRSSSRWAGHFADFQKPYVHFAPETYRLLAEKCGFRVGQMSVEENAWNFGSREAVHAFCRVTFAEWTRRLPEEEWDKFIEEVLDQYQLVAATSAEDANTFKFYQLEVVLAPA